MAQIQKNYGDFLKMVFTTLDRKPATDTEARMNFKEVLVDYCNFLCSLEPLPSNSYFLSQKQYIDKLQVLLGRFQTLGSEFLEDDKVDTFLYKLQDQMRSWVNMDDSDKKLYELEKEYYTQLAWDTINHTKVTGNKFGFQNENMTEVEKLKSKINFPGMREKYVNF